MISSAPHKDIIDAVFREDYRPAAYRWVNAMQPEVLNLFERVFKRLTVDDIQTTDLEKVTQKTTLTASKYTIPEWNILPINEVEKNVEDRDSVEALLRKPTESNLTYTNFTNDQRKVCRAVPTRTRDSDKSQINSTENSPAYISRWAERNMKTTYVVDYCNGETTSAIKNQTKIQQVLVYSKGVVNERAMQRALKYIDTDVNWTRSFREMCRSLVQSADSTAYRTAHTIVKKPAPGERFVHPKWRDPIPTVSQGEKRAPESYWKSEEKTAYVPLKKPEETFKAASQHKACYSCPFDHTPLTEKVLTTTMRGDYPDYLANKDDHPLYFQDMKVTIPPGTAAVGEVVGKGGVRGY